MRLWSEAMRWFDNLGEPWRFILVLLIAQPIIISMSYPKLIVQHPFIGGVLLAISIAVVFRRIIYMCSRRNV